MQKTSLWQRFSSHIILLGLGGLFLIGVGVLGAAEQEATVEEAAVAEGQADEVESMAEDGTGAAAEAAVSRDPSGTPVPTVDLTRVPILSDYSLAPELDPNTFVGERPAHNFTTYVVERGDAPASIAERFGITTETILGGNPRLSNEASQLQTGVELIILPIDGVLHTVSRGETLESISLRYGIPAEEIIAYEDNNLEFPYRLFADTQLVIPGAFPAEEFVWNPPSLIQKEMV